MKAAISHGGAGWLRCRIAGLRQWIPSAWRSHRELSGELAGTAAVVLAVVLVSGPCRGELPGRMAAAACRWWQAQARELFVPQMVTASTFEAVVDVAAITGCWALILVLAWAVNRAGRVRDYLFHAEIDRQLGQLSPRLSCLGIALVVSFTCALVCRGTLGEAATLLFVLLLPAVRWLRGGTLEISVHSRGRCASGGARSDRRW